MVKRTTLTTATTNTTLTTFAIFALQTLQNTTETLQGATGLKMHLFAIIDIAFNRLLVVCRILSIESCSVIDTTLLIKTFFI